MVDKLVGEAQVLLEEQHRRASGPLRATLTKHWFACEIGRIMIFAERDIAVVFAVASAITDLHQDRARAEGILHEARTNPGVYEVFLVAAAPGSAGV